MKQTYYQLSDFPDSDPGLERNEALWIMWGLLSALMIILYLIFNGH